MEDKEKKEHGADCKCQDCKNGVCKPCGKSGLMECGSCSACPHKKIACLVISIVVAVFLLGLAFASGFAFGRASGFGRFRSYGPGMMGGGYYNYYSGQRMMQPGNQDNNRQPAAQPDGGFPQNGTNTNQ